MDELNRRAVIEAIVKEMREKVEAVLQKHRASRLTRDMVQSPRGRRAGKS